jgi:hypothetical protein
MGSRAAISAFNTYPHDNFVLGAALLAYPLHPPGQKDNLRDQLLRDMNRAANVVLVSGDKDPFNDLKILNRILADLATKPQLHVVKGAGHGFSGKNERQVVEHVVEFCRGVKPLLAPADVKVAANIDGEEDNDGEERRAPKKKRTRTPAGKNAAAAAAKPKAKRAKKKAA